MLSSVVVYWTNRINEPCSDYGQRKAENKLTSDQYLHWDRCCYFHIEKFMITSFYLTFIIQLFFLKTSIFSFTVRILIESHKQCDQKICSNSFSFDRNQYVPRRRAPLQSKLSRRRNCTSNTIRWQFWCECQIIQHPTWHAVMDGLYVRWMACINALPLFWPSV